MLSKNQIKEIQSLQLKKHRDLKGLFLAEGIKTAVEVFESRPEIISTVYATKDFVHNYGNEMNAKKISYELVTEDELKKISFLTSPNGVLLVCKYFTNVSSKQIAPNDFNLYLDDIRDPGNFGTIIRLAAWYGVNTVYCSPASCDLYNPKVIQSTMGTFLRVNVVYKELKELVTEKGLKKIYGAVLNGKDLYREKLTGGLIVIGNEANGINETNLPLLTDKITIPSAGKGAESLNAAMAASIIISEFFRQLQVISK